MNCGVGEEISPGITLEGMMLKLKLQYFGHLMRRADSLEKTLMLGGIGGGGEGDDRGWDGWMASLTRWTWVWVNSGSWWWTGRPGVLWFMGLQKSQTRLSNWTELNWTVKGRAIIMISLEQKNDMIIQITKYSSCGFRHRQSSLTHNDLHIFYEVESKCLGWCAWAQTSWECLLREYWAWVV